MTSHWNSTELRLGRGADLNKAGTKHALQGLLQGPRGPGLEGFAGSGGGEVEAGVLSDCEGPCALRGGDFALAE